ncbi:pirin family protein [Vibrio superstes]|uniref:Pirin family protein n=1 Tax=Vibrio superstes NBRC 103154 TaxID=1219062 RepID=A0A511QNV6_9VIBR|nr:pirin family protein [Vibrio superstes]GEM79015.1 hypothetical protein VSU01S_12600 [Vibrio superstes NBRC 103154]
MIEVRKSDDRGLNDWGWLTSRNTFSVGNYYDPNHMGYSSLRVLNDDLVSAGTGFPSHPHKDMEIISMVIAGKIEHKDNQGNVRSLSPGEFQLMSAGKGIVHSEYNGSSDDDLRFIQIWIEPNTTGGTPSYQQRAFRPKQGITAIVTPDGANETLKIKQDMTLSQLILNGQGSLSMSLDPNRRAYLQIIEGPVTLNGLLLQNGDGAKITSESKLDFQNNSDSNIKALIFSLT